MAKQQENANPKIHTPGVFIPTWGDNHKRGNPVKFHYPRITRSMRRRYGALCVLVDGRPVAAASLPVAGVLIAEECCRICVDKVENYAADDGEKITNGDELAEHGDDMYIQEFYVWVEKGATFSDMEKKISDESSDSSGQDTPLSDGTAEDVEPPSSTLPEAVDLEEELAAQ